MVEPMNSRVFVSVSAAPLAQRGIALVLVLWLTALLTVIAGGFAYAMRNEAQAARNTISQAQARALADGAVCRTVFELMRPRTITGVWAADGLVHVWDEDGLHVAAVAVDESGKIDLNAVTDALLKSLLQTAASSTPTPQHAWSTRSATGRTPTICAAERRRSGRVSGSRPVVQARERRLRDGCRLAARSGHDAGAVRAVAGNLTVYSGPPGINPQFASRTVLMALPGATDADRRYLHRAAGRRARRRLSRCRCSAAAPAPARR